jgi:hypothetical protein
MKNFIKKIVYKKKTLALVVNEKNFLNSGVHFVTPNSFPLQIGFMNHKKNTLIKPHTHLKHHRKINDTTEVLFVKNGSLRVDFFNNSKKYLFSKIIKKNNILVLIEGSHGFKILNKCRLIEVKQGPFIPHLDKKKFNLIDEKKIKIKK